ncbi:MAG TPA: CPBP family intramembrane glutamic endopeptidase [Kofleriaceae bacterium]|nr:CPBP family intramembrane glutamic endopeptidase [Kofleriaceae bacterium]
MTDPPSGRPVGTAHAARALVRVATRRMLNRLARGFARAKKGGGRTATAPKRKRSPVLLLLLGALFVFTGFNSASQLVGRVALATGASDRGGALALPHEVHMALIGARRGDDADERREAIDALASWRAGIRGDDRATPEDESAAAAWLERYRADESSIVPARTVDAWRFDAQGGASRAAGTVGLLLTLLLAALVAISLGAHARHLGDVGWSLEWLFGFPVRARSLFLALVAERAVTNAFGWILFLSLWGALFAALGAGWWTFLLAPAAALACNVQVAALHVLVETTLRRALSPRRLRNVQAVLSVLGSLLFLCALAPVYQEDAAAWIAARAPAWLAYLPWSLAAASATLDRVDVASLAGMLALAGAVVAAAVLAAERLVAGGLVTGGGSPDGVRGTGATPTPSRLRGVVGRELRMLGRDRALAAQTLVAPLLVIGFQVVINPGLWTGAAESPARAAGLAFGIGAWVMVQAGLLLVATEGQSLWLLYTLPQPLGRMLGSKVAVWSVIGLAYTLAVLVAVAIASGTVSLALLLEGALAMLGVGVVTVISGALGVLHGDPHASDGRKVDPTSFWLALFAAGLYGYTFVAPPWPRAVLVILAVLTAAAQWQRASDDVPYLLDPTDRPPPALVVSDGILSVLVFAVLQALIGGVLFHVLVPAAALVTSFAVAGLLVVLAALRTLRRRGVPRVAVSIGWAAAPGARGHLRSLATGAVIGLAAAAIALLYFTVLARLVGPIDPVEGSPAEIFDRDTLLAFALLAVVAAPLVEETLFRGILYGGLRRTFSPAVAVLTSAALFAVIHPPIAFPAVFTLGAGAALARERTGRLAAAIAAHAAYNAIIVLAAAL